MASMAPFAQLTGTLQVYLGPVGEPVPAVNATPTGNWYLLGPTDGNQTYQTNGKLKYFRDNDHQAPVKAVRADEELSILFTLVGLTLENWARILHSAALLTSVGGSPATRKMPLKRGATPTEYTMLFRGATLSPYGVFPGMFVIPRGVFDGEPKVVFARDGRPGVECDFSILEDDTQAIADRMGWLIVQTS